MAKRQLLDSRLVLEPRWYPDLKFLDLPDLIGKTVTSALKTEDGFILGFGSDTALRVHRWEGLKLKGWDNPLYVIPSVKP